MHFAMQTQVTPPIFCKDWKNDTKTVFVIQEVQPLQNPFVAGEKGKKGYLDQKELTGFQEPIKLMPVENKYEAAFKILDTIENPLALNIVYDPQNKKITADLIRKRDQIS